MVLDVGLQMMLSEQSGCTCLRHIDCRGILKLLQHFCILQASSSSDLGVQDAAFYRICFSAGGLELLLTTCTPPTGLIYTYTILVVPYLFQQKLPSGIDRWTA